MINHSIKDISISTERHKLYTFICSPDALHESIDLIKKENICVVNIGIELATYLEALEDYRYLNIEVSDYLRKLFETKKTKLNNTGNPILAIYNLGILLEPRLELNATQLLKDFSKSAALIILWENQSDQPHQLNWPTQKQKYFFDFTDTPLKKLQNAL